jgi:hypothetical protein
MHGAVGGDIAAGAGHVLDHRGLIPQCRQSVAHDARDDVDRSARRIADQDVHGVVRIFALRERARRRRERGERRQKHGGGFYFDDHCFLPSLFS